jgi:GT2 family glycosyltransferase
MFVENPIKTESEQLAIAQIKIVEQQQEIARLQQALEQRTQDVNQLIQWMQSLQQDILAVYSSITWQMGDVLTQIVLKILRRSSGPTARDHIRRILTRFDAWKINYFQTRRQSGVSAYQAWHDTREYQLWIQHYTRLTPIILRSLPAQVQQWAYQPVISLLMPITSPNKQWLHQAIITVQTQIYPHWELWLLPLASNSAILTEYVNYDNRIKIFNNIDQNLANVLNAILPKVMGEFIALVGAEDQLAVDALFQIVKFCNQDKNSNVLAPYDLIYTDEDKLNAEGQRYDPYFKSDWNPDLFYSQHYLRHLTLYRCSQVQQVGGFTADYPGYEDYDLILRLLAQFGEEKIGHVPQVLYHQRVNLSLPISSAINALQAHFQRLNQPVQVVQAQGGHTRVIYPLPEKPPLVSLIIPTRDKVELLRGTMIGILQQTDYPHLEVIIMDNGSVEAATLDYLTEIQTDTRVKVIRHAAPFNYSQLNNIGVSQATGEIIGLLNNDLEMIHSQWLIEMVSHALRPEIGAVGAKLYYANDTIQHAGVIVGLGGMAGHGLKFLARQAPGYQWKPFLIQNYSAVTAACLVMRKAIFTAVGGLNEKHLKVAFNDVDLCLKIRAHGYRILWTPYAELYHLESVSRGNDNTLKKYLRLRHELNYMKRRWGKTLLNDPYYNPNLTLEYEDFSLAWRINGVY